MLIGSNSYLLRRIVSPNMVTFASSITFQNHVLLPAMTYKVVRREDDDALDDVRAAGASGRWTEAAFAPEGAMPMRELASRSAQEPGAGTPKLPSGYT